MADDPQPTRLSGGYLTRDATPEQHQELVNDLQAAAQAALDAAARPSAE